METSCVCVWFSQGLHSKRSCCHRLWLRYCRVLNRRDATFKKKPKHGKSWFCCGVRCILLMAYQRWAWRSFRGFKYKNLDPPVCSQVLPSTTWTLQPPGWRASTSQCRTPKSWRTTAYRRSKTSSSLSKRPSTSETHIWVHLVHTGDSEIFVNTARLVL